MDLYGLIETKLNEFKIPFEIVDCPLTLTTEEADNFIEGIESVQTKSMFLKNKKKTAYYLLIMDEQKRLDMDRIK